MIGMKKTRGGEELVEAVWEESNNSFREGDWEEGSTACLKDGGHNM